MGSVVEHRLSCAPVFSESSLLCRFFHRCFISLVLVAVLTGFPASAQELSVPPGERLADLVPKGFDIGGVVGGYDEDWPVQDSLFVAANEFNSLMGAVFMPFGAWPIQEDGPDTSGWENAVDFACDNGLRVHGHVLLYPAINPNLAWLNDLPDAELEGVLQRFVTEIAAVRAGQVGVWQVVNEVMADSGDEMDPETGLRSSYREYSVIGSDYVEKAFRWAKAADPEAELIINDYSIASINDKSDRLLAYMLDMRSRGVPIDGVGMQLHLLDLQFEPDYQSIRDNIARFSEAGFKVYLTELDVVSKATQDPTDFPSEEELERQATIYGEIAKLAVEEQGCNGLYLWDYIDQRNTFLHPITFDLANLVAGDFTFPSPFTIADGELVAKPAYFALQDAFSMSPKTFWLVNCWYPWRGFLARWGTPGEDCVYSPDSFAYFQRFNRESIGWASMRWQVIPAENPNPDSTQKLYRIRNLWEPETGYLSRGGDFVDSQWIPNKDIYLDRVYEDYYSQLWGLSKQRNGTFRLVNQWGTKTGKLLRPRIQVKRRYRGRTVTRYLPEDFPSFQGVGNRVTERSPGLGWYLIEIPRGY